MRAMRADDDGLSYAVDGFTDAQTRRIRYGEQLRAVLQGRASRWSAPVAVEDADTGRQLKEIREHGGGPIPLLGSLYASAWRQEREMMKEMEKLIASHPAWDWLSGVKGVGPTLAARLLTRLDITRARSPAGFWAYCGLSTVPAELFVCPECGAQTMAEGHTRFKAGHPGPDGARCSGSYIASGAAPGVRVAQPRPRHGERSRYDMEAKRICYLVGVSFVRCGGPYREHYDERRRHLQAMHPAWAPKRIHMAAMRATVKRFLVHLWTAWNELATAWPAAEQGDEPPSARQAVMR
ncbi:MAG: transposase [Gemmatimonadales bacterium]